jgi:CubicO group peptidase (beta-lactamase class C family)
VNDKDLQELVDEVAQRLGVVGGQVALFHGEETLQCATGWRDREHRLPATTETLFQIGSTAKLFNAMLAMSLTDAGVLDLDTPVHEYIEDLQLSDPIAQQSITLRHLLSMSAGIDVGFYHDYGRGDDALGRYVAAFAGVPHVFPPGSTFGYSNASTNVAGHAAARATGRSWERLLRERVVDPCGLTEATLFAEEMLFHPVATGYTARTDAEPVRTTEWWLPRSLGPAGSVLCCSAGALVAIARMLLDRGRANGGAEVLSDNAVEAMHTPQIRLRTRLFADEWCIGPYRKQWDGHAIFGHSGTGFSGSSTLLWCPAKRIAIATVVNTPSLGYPFADAIFDVLFAQVFGIAKPATLKPEDVAPVEDDMARYAGTYTASGMALVVAVEQNKLMLTFQMGASDYAKSELIPLGDGRFLPREPTISGNRMWDVAFWGEDSCGRPTHVLQGVFAFLKRVT